MLRILVTVSLLLVGIFGDDSKRVPVPERVLGGGCVCTPTVNCPGDGSGGDGADVQEDLEDIKEALSFVTAGIQTGQDAVEERFSQISARLDGIESTMRQILAAISVRPTPTPSGDCPYDFTLKTSGETKICYKLVLRNRMSWFSAQDMCHAMGPRVRLLVLDTRQKYDMMEEVQQTMRSELGPWVGGKKDVGDEEFVWAEAGGTTLNYDTWWSGEPSDSVPACTNIYCGSSECGLWDASCNSGSRDYYCEKY